MLEGREENEAVKQQKIADAVKRRVARSKEAGQTLGQIGDISELLDEDEYHTVEAVLLASSKKLKGTAELAKEAVDTFRKAVCESGARFVSNGGGVQPRGGGGHETAPALAPSRCAGPLHRRWRSQEADM